MEPTYAEKVKALEANVVKLIEKNIPDVEQPIAVGLLAMLCDLAIGVSQMNHHLDRIAAASEACVPK